MEQRGGDRHVVEAEAGQDAGHRQRVADVGVAGTAHLVLVGLLGHLVGPLDPADLALGVALQERGEQRGDLGAGVVAAPGHDRPAPSTRRSMRRSTVLTTGPSVQLVLVMEQRQDVAPGQLAAGRRGSRAR